MPTYNRMKINGKIIVSLEESNKIIRHTLKNLIQNLEEGLYLIIGIMLQDNLGKVTLTSKPSN